MPQQALHRRARQALHRRAEPPACRRAHQRPGPAWARIGSLIGGRTDSGGPSWHPTPKLPSSRWFLEREGHHLRLAQVLKVLAWTSWEAHHPPLPAPSAPGHARATASSPGRSTWNSLRPYLPWSAWAHRFLCLSETGTSPRPTAAPAGVKAAKLKPPTPPAPPRARTTRPPCACARQAPPPAATKPTGTAQAPRDDSRGA
mmetsp:Transcript_34226/g.98275  ORF Transcript_34226/g.98275 Transcript_34226/m.98275 type:complete len:201 (-) Transcript_34226:7-609(-)